MFSQPLPPGKAQGGWQCQWLSPFRASGCPLPAVPLEEPEGWEQEKGLPQLGQGHSAHAGNPSAAGISHRQKEYLREDLSNQLDGGSWFHFL